VSGVRAFESNGIDTGVFPNYIRAPHERHKDMDQQIDRKKISQVNKHHFFEHKRKELCYGAVTLSKEKKRAGLWINTKPTLTINL